ncbi:cbb3-type cytochrome oxidase assembly protein CcoS [Microbulbifer litoralis]|uniref:cbb3-type cytochrome oxidase assembly protein CcoS n=1 Tax=Microbulbifer litoralis TaxID=2933965 RepID=UPI0020282765|nr:cbb3-type cytochrome oxidase assembly protein CcoS [Microbulbifer sp. GX H0434]
MDSLYFLIPIAIIFVATAVKLFFWAVNNGQYDDLETEGRRILFDDDEPAEARREDSDGDGAGEC